MNSVAVATLNRVSGGSKNKYSINKTIFDGGQKESM